MSYITLTKVIGIALIIPLVGYPFISYKVYCIFPSKDVLQEITTFESAILAFMVPLSIEIISKISERYQSEVMTAAFQSSIWVKLLPYFLLVNITLNIFLLLSENVGYMGILWKIFSWLSLAWFGVIVVILSIVIKRIYDFIANPKIFLEQLYQNAMVSLDE